MSLRDPVTLPEVAGKREVFLWRLELLLGVEIHRPTQKFIEQGAGFELSFNLKHKIVLTEKL